MSKNILRINWRIIEKYFFCNAIFREYTHTHIQYVLVSYCAIILTQT